MGLLFNRLYIRYSYCFLLIIILFTLLLSACSKEKLEKPIPYSKHESIGLKDSVPLSYFGKEFSLPIDVEEGNFYSSVGWLDNHSIIYITELGSSTNVYLYDLYEGKSRKIFESEFPIVSAQISPSKEQFLIHSAPTTFEAQINVFSKDGNETFTKRIASSELTFEWNPFNENLLLVSSFTEDWDFNTYKLNIEERTLSKLELTQPFSYWLNDNELVYLDWDLNNPSFFANVKKINLNSKVVEDLFSNIYQVAMIGDKLLTIKVDENVQETAIYTFYSNSLQELKSFVMPHLSRYSDWLVPFYEYLSQKDEFLTLKPLYSGEFDMYREGFELVSYSLHSESEEVLFEHMDNERLSCSPSGTHCLYGNYLDNLLDLEEKSVIKLVED